MNPERLNPEHSEVARKARERIQQHIARVVFRAAEGLEPREQPITEEEAS